MPVNFRLSADEVGYIVEHSGASVLLVDPELDEALAGVTCKHRFVIGARGGRRAVPGRRRARALGARRGRDRHDQLHERHHRPAQGRAADAPQLLDQRHHLRMAGRRRDRDVYLHTLPMFHCNGWGMPYASTGMGGHPGRDPQGRRRRDPAPHRGARRHAAVRGAGGGQRGARRRRGLGRPDPRRGRTRIVVAGAPPPTRTIERVETELGWEFIQIYGLTETAPLLTMNRSRAEWDDLRPRSGPASWCAAGAPALGVRMRRRRRG